MSATFTAAFADPFGADMCDVRAPMTLAFTRNQAPRIDVALDIESDQAVLLVTALRDGLPRLKVWRRGPGDATGTLIVNTPWAPMQETGKDDGLGEIAASFRGPFALLESRFTPATVTYTATDAGTIAWNLITATETADGSIGVDLGAIEATIVRDRTYEHKQIAEAITQLTQVIDGFDFEITPLDSALTVGEFNVYARQGNDLSTGDQAIVFEYGPGTIGNVRGVTRQTTPPVNKARVIGANGLIGSASSPASITEYGTFETVEQAVDVSEQATLNAKAQGLLKPDPVRVVEFTPDPELAPQPWRDFWLGDTVRFRARHGAMDIDMALRVNGITVQIDDEGTQGVLTVNVDQGV